ncbi:hypothetical protein LTR53_001812 [Teratosphaeriaceae sp. CCFEE 6253]|nr:hypothetical protein LTR53_001812 [Teratosphaeriaceae sp. CCFEE 6253]
MATPPHADTTPDPSTFWNTNLPPAQHTRTCPPYLAYAFTNAKDRAILATPDTAYTRQTWPEVQKLIADNRLDLFQRVPRDLRLYKEYCARLVEEYGSVMEFVMRERLGWQDLSPRGEPFEHASDHTILLNDWPYGLDARIVHVVVWTKFALPSDPATDDLTPEARRATQVFVDEVFVKPCGRENVVWFKNWSSLKSIHAVEHFHVMLFDPEEGFVKGVTGGDVALAEKVGRAGIV